MDGGDEEKKPIEFVRTTQRDKKTCVRALKKYISNFAREDATVIHMLWLVKNNTDEPVSLRPHFYCYPSLANKLMLSILLCIPILYVVIFVHCIKPEAY